jgi:hypothetical protein
MEDLPMTILRDVLALVVGLVVGGVVNMSLVMLGPSVIPPPAGVDVTRVESLAASMHLFEPRHFLFPFLAHALGTLAGAFVAHRLAARRKQAVAWAVGAAFLVGGIAAARIGPAPTWFGVLDLLGAYLPMAWLGGSLARRLQAGGAGTHGPAGGIANRPERSPEP